MMWSRRRFGGALLSAASLGMVGLGRAGADARPRTHRVIIEGFAFAPNRLSIQAGDTVEWINRDLVPHTATAEGGSWDTGELAKDVAGRIIFLEPGRASYLCIFHPNMTGEIAVTAPGGATN